MARPRAADYETKRSAILKKSAELFASHGFSAASITMIAQACGVSKALLYHYYPDKEAVLFDVIEAHLRKLVEVVDAAANAAPDARLRVHAVAAALLDAYRDADAEHQVQIANLKLLAESSQERLRVLERRLVDTLADAIASALPEIGRGPLLKPLTMSMFGMLNWHYLWFREGGAVGRGDYARFVSELVLSGGDSAARSVLPAMPQASKRGRTA